MNSIIPKLNRAIGLLAKIRHYVPKSLLKTIYYSLFNSHLTYACQIWAQSSSIKLDKLSKLQDKAMRIINFLPPRSPVNKTYNDSKILKLKDFVLLQNVLFVKDGISHSLPNTFSRYFKKVNETHSHFTRNNRNELLSQPSVRTIRYGIDSIKYKSIKAWNEIQRNASDDLQNLKRSTFKHNIKKHILNNYLNV